LLQFSEARDLPIQPAELATMAFLERNPKDFDNPDLLKLLFLKPALAKAQDERVKEMAEFRAKQLHQKAEIARIDISNGVLICSSADEGTIGNQGIYHNFDYPFYYFNIRSNAANRVTKFLAAEQ